MSRAAIRLHVDELVLEGVAPAERHRFADALQQELGDLLARPTPWPRDSRTMDAVDCGAARVKGASGFVAGAAESIYRGVVTAVAGTQR